jgi:hypothetical protein
MKQILTLDLLEQILENYKEPIKNRTTKLKLWSKIKRCSVTNQLKNFRFGEKQEFQTTYKCRLIKVFFRKSMNFKSSEGSLEGSLSEDDLS